MPLALLLLSSLAAATPDVPPSRRICIALQQPDPDPAEIDGWMAAYREAGSFYEPRCRVLVDPDAPVPEMPTSQVVLGAYAFLFNPFLGARVLQGERRETMRVHPLHLAVRSGDAALVRQVGAQGWDQHDEHRLSAREWAVIRAAATGDEGVLTPFVELGWIIDSALPCGDPGCEAAGVYAAVRTLCPGEPIRTDRGESRLAALRTALRDGDEAAAVRVVACGLERRTWPDAWSAARAAGLPAVLDALAHHKVRAPPIARPAPPHPPTLALALSVGDVAAVRHHLDKGAAIDGEARRWVRRTRIWGPVAIDKLEVLVTHGFVPSRRTCRRVAVPRPHTEAACAAR